MNEASYTPATKKRRLNVASTVNKPFVSPLKVRKAPATPSSTARAGSNTSRSPYIPSALSHTHRAVSPCYSPLNTLETAVSPGTPPPTCGKPTLSTRQVSYHNRFEHSDPEALGLQKAISSLEMQIRAARNDIDILQQAAKITGSKSDDELTALAQKWRQAAQSAAESLFPSVKARVDNMGGVAAWRDAERVKFGQSYDSVDPPTIHKPCDTEAEGESNGSTGSAYASDGMSEKHERNEQDEVANAIADDSRAAEQCLHEDDDASRASSSTKSCQC